MRATSGTQDASPPIAGSNSHPRRGGTYSTAAGGLETLRPEADGHKGRKTPKPASNSIGAEQCKSLVHDIITALSGNTQASGMEHPSPPFLFDQVSAGLMEQIITWLKFFAKLSDEKERMLQDSSRHYAAQRELDQQQLAQEQAKLRDSEQRSQQLEHEVHRVQQERQLADEQRQLAVEERRATDVKYHASETHRQELEQQLAQQQARLRDSEQRLQQLERDVQRLEYERQLANEQLRKADEERQLAVEIEAKYHASETHRQELEQQLAREQARLRDSEQRSQQLEQQHCVDDVTCTEVTRQLEQALQALRQRSSALAHARP